MFFQLLIQLRVLNGDSNLMRESFETHSVCRMEEILMRAVEVDESNDSVLDNDGHAEVGVYPCCFKKARPILICAHMRGDMWLPCLEHAL